MRFSGQTAYQRLPEPGPLDERLVAGDENFIGAGRDPDPDPRARLLRLQRLEPPFELFEQRQPLGQGAGPRLLSSEPRTHSRGRDPFGEKRRFPDRRLRQTSRERAPVLPRAAADSGGDGRALRGPADDGHGRVGARLRDEGVRLVHLDDGLDGILRGDEPAELAAVVVEHPAVGADEGAHAAVFELAQGGFEEGDVQVGPPPHRRVGRAVESGEIGRHVFEPDVGRVADDEIGARQAGGFRQVIPDPHPA
jgi:hypothetical protein